LKKRAAQHKNEAKKAKNKKSQKNFKKNTKNRLTNTKTALYWCQRGGEKPPNKQPAAGQKEKTQHNIKPRAAREPAAGQTANKTIGRNQKPQKTETTKTAGQTAERQRKPWTTTRRSQ
jgi:hypothetical protein